MVFAGVIIGLLAATSGLKIPVLCFAFGWMWYVGTVVLALSPRRVST